MKRALANVAGYAAVSGFWLVFAYCIRGWSA